MRITWQLSRSQPPESGKGEGSGARGLGDGEVGVGVRRAAREGRRAKRGAGATAARCAAAGLLLRRRRGCWLRRAARALPERPHSQSLHC